MVGRRGGPAEPSTSPHPLKGRRAFLQMVCVVRPSGSTVGEDPLEYVDAVLWKPEPLALAALAALAMVDSDLVLRLSSILQGSELPQPRNCGFLLGESFQLLP
mmetsp:Transcript_27033/g.62943  ORF Transcript_27033/g.62943 Transcript_27033/m.62943 type:complete len:103 (-) Transcript_27033:421-729(-)